ncbi:hypothetical protein A3D71_01095 [Candidatus Kaiserbacteria bacterium RIFCSPHIGHO2_02_FULL_55_20]|uniref:Serine protease n=1 Tax=Candidatus Kaiserbacteria bacterium RIFCSPHIGHO2_02_FULL_55_20 TaxID=1798497 RepID=A0A1F6DVY4_9BACT|nr:MAG: hypothetical protein A2680_02640 [Candidatus Kaiserbacteria bacterium RIFCSPHIGHO2_01_FULL_55_37]OGG65497.1 MAG: hypothetical protein A3D71_01095 [Candidatus Kaiserbacteria bacterium RIFCSPHIGHO2_02_FULL_55_20]
MNMEQLSKSQIVLLTLLVSFVTSIATGIVTVSLMDQAPPVVAQTVNRIIERTIETVTVEPKAQAAATVITQEKTVVVKESDLISQALTRVNPSVVRLFTTSTDTPAFLALGVVMDASGTIVSDADIFKAGDVAVAELANGAHVRVTLTSQDATSAVAYFASATTTTEGKSVTWSPISIAGVRPALGTTVIAIGGKSTPRVGTGIVTTLIASEAEGGPQVIDTDIGLESIYAGAPLISTEGNLLGLRTGVARAATATGFVSASVLMKKEEKKDETKKGSII